MNVYQGADRAILEMNRQNLKAFGKLKLAKFDELNLIRQINAVYDESVRRAKQRYYEIAVEAFIVAMLEAKKPNDEATRTADEIITGDWILDMLEEVDPVTLYAFMNEAERKKQRLIEALAVANNRNAEIDKALRYWTQQIGQYAITSVDNARLDAFKAAGVEKVMWNTNLDGRECDKCRALNGKVFRIDKVPPKQHYGDRCWLTPVFD